MTPKRTFGGAIVLLAALFVIQPDVPTVAIADAAEHDGRTVMMAGTATSVRPWGDGLRIVLHADGHAVPVDAPMTDATPGDWLRIEGRLHRVDGELRLRADSIAQARGPDPTTVPLAVVADDPSRWQDRIRIQGTAHDGHLRDGAHAIRLGEGPWLEGPVDAAGVIAYDVRCLCHVLHASQVRPWTP